MIAEEEFVVRYEAQRTMTEQEIREVVRDPLYSDEGLWRACVEWVRERDSE